MSPRRVPALLALLLLSGCATLRQRTECREHGGPEWRELTSAHFRVATNVDEAEARRQVRAMERMRRTLALMWGDAFDPPGQVDVLLVRDEDELQALTGSDRAAVSWAGRRPLIVMERQWLDGDDDLSSTQAHELTHYLSSHVLLRQPRWVAEGLAVYLSTVSVSGRGTEATFGRPPGHLQALLRRQLHRPLRELWEWTDQDLRPGVSDAFVNHFYASAWAWVHHLVNHHQARFDDFMHRLGRAEEPRQAWAAAFAGVPETQLENELLASATSGFYNWLRLRVPDAPEADVRARTLLPDEVHVLRIRAALHRSQDAVAQELAGALETAPDSPRVWAVRASWARDLAELTHAAEQATRLGPGYAEGWYLLGSARQRAAAQARGPERERLFGEAEEALRHALELDPEHTEALNTLAWVHVQRGRPAPARGLAARAARLAPYKPHVLATLAAAEALAGRCPQAVAAQQRALDLLLEGTSPATRAELEQRLSTYQTRCPAPAAQAP